MILKARQLGSIGGASKAVPHDCKTGLSTGGKRRKVVHSTELLRYNDDHSSSIGDGI